MGNSQQPPETLIRLAGAKRNYLMKSDVAPDTKTPLVRLAAFASDGAGEVPLLPGDRDLHVVVADVGHLDAYPQRLAQVRLSGLGGNGKR